MSGRLVSLGLALALLVAVGGGIVAACYEIPRPACGFICGADGACPDGYTCAADRYCHGAGAPDDLVCSHPDATLPADARPDASPDAAALDAATDAPDDAPPDAAPDAP